MALFEAVAEGNAQNVQELLEHAGANADIDATDDDGFTALHHAVKRKNLFGNEEHSATEYQKMKVRAIKEAKKTGYLLRQAKANDLAVLTILCEYRADVNKLTSFGRFRSPLYLAVETGHLDIVKFLVCKRADVDQATDSDRWYKEKGETPLHRAAYKGRLDIAKVLVSEGASINATDGDGWTPLHSASYLGRHDIAEFLINAGAAVNEQDSEGLTPLNCASERGNVEIISFLCQKGGNVQDKDTDGLTPLHHASERGHLKTVVYLLEKGANINQADPDGGTPLHYACRWGHLNTVAHLVEKGADVRMGDKDGETATHHAARKGNLDILKILLDKGAKVNQQTEDGSTPVHIASTLGHSDALRHFLRHGAKLDVQNEKGETPIDCASDDEIRTILQRFQKDGVILEDDEVLNYDAQNRESGGEPSLDELYEVARSVQKVSEFWRLFKELSMDDATIANALPIRETFKAARQILQTWSDSTPGKISEKKKALKKIPEYELLSSTKGMSYGDILDEISRRIYSVTQFIKMSSRLGYSATQVMLQIDGSPSLAVNEKLFDSSLLLLSQWANEGGQRDTLLQSLQTLHLTAPAEAVSTAIQKQPDLAENFSFSAIDHEGGDIQVGEGDVQITLPPGSLPEDSCEVVTIRVPEHVPEIPQYLVEEEEIQASPPVQCSPSGLKFKQPVKITVPHCTSPDKFTAATEVILYTKDDKGDFEREVMKSKDYKITKDAIVVNVNHFSSFYVSFKKLAGFKVGLLPFHPVKMPSTRKPLLEIYVYKMYKRNEKKISNSFKKLNRNYRQAADAWELLMEEENEDITIICPSSTGDKEKKIKYSSIKGRPSNKVTFEVDFTDQTYGTNMTKNIELKWKQGSGEEESQYFEATLEASQEQVQQLQRALSISEEYETPPGEFESLFLDISEELGGEDIHKLGVRLKLRMVQIKRFEDTNHMGSVIGTKGTFYMLCHWYKREMTKKKPKILETLRKALVLADLVELAEGVLPYKGDEGLAEDEEESEDEDKLGDSMTNNLAERPLWASVAGTVNSKYRGAYSLSRASSKKKDTM